MEYILAINAGSSSLKFSLFKIIASSQIELDLAGSVSLSNQSYKIKLKDGAGKQIDSQAFSENLKSIAFSDLATIIPNILERVRPNLKLRAIGHRVVHGGNRFAGPVLIDETVFSALETLIRFAPLHQPLNLAPIKTLQEFFPKVPQIACFDTCFHQTQSELNKIIALPKRFRDEGVCNYGFHGLSYEFIAAELKAKFSDQKLEKVIVAHLGSGASLCALKDGKSIATTMGFSALSGLVMATRPGNLDSGVLLYLMDRHALGAKELEKILYSESGLLAVSGISGDMQELLESTDERAKLAVDLFAYRISREIGSLVAALAGLDALVFTGGIGENSAAIRERVCQQASWLGIDLDQEANSKNRARISVPISKIVLLLIKTDENFVIANHALKIKL